LDIIAELKRTMNKLIEDPVKAFLPFVLSILVITIVLVLISFCLSFIMLFSFNCLSNQNCTPANITTFINQNSSGLIGIFTNSLLTTGLIIFSALSVYSAQRTLKQSQNEQQTREIEKRLELFYIPAQNIMKVADEYIKNPAGNDNKLKIERYQKRGYEYSGMPPQQKAVLYTVENLKEIERYRFLATKVTCKLFSEFLYEEENNENRIALSKSIEKDVKEYVKRLYDLKQEE
jgi:hypothetical protein